MPLYQESYRYKLDTSNRPRKPHLSVAKVQAADGAAGAAAPRGDGQRQRHLALPKPSARLKEFSHTSRLC